MFISLIIFLVLGISNPITCDNPRNGGALMYPDCVDPFGDYGWCIPLLRCRSLFRILRQTPINPIALKYLKKATCGFGRKNTPKVCCGNKEDIDAWKAFQTDNYEASTTTSTTTTPKPKPTKASPVIEYELGTFRDAFNLSKATNRRLHRHPNFHLLPGIDACGISMTTTDRIIGGQNAGLGQFPWMVLLAFKKVEDPYSKAQFACGGALISELYVITASHCVVNLPGSYELTFVRIGEHNLDETEDCVHGICSDPVQDIEIDEIISHPKFDETKLKENDIALIRLKRPAIFGTFVTPICLPFDIDLESNPQSPILQLTKLTVAGWGRTVYDNPDGATILQFARIPLISLSTCDAYYKRQVPLGGIDDSRFCAGGEEGIDSCRGDSGGPLAEILPIRDPKTPSLQLTRMYQLGIVSLGPVKCGTKNQPGLYTKITHHLLWILDIIRP